MEELLEPVLTHLDRHDPGGVVGVYLYGSGATDGLGPHSDVDLLVLTRRSLTADERALMVAMLLAASGWVGHADRYPEVAGRRPLELTSLVVGDTAPLVATSRRDFQFGEWLREDLAEGYLPTPADDPDTVILLATALDAHRVLRGPALEEVLAPVPPDVVASAQRALLPGLVDTLVGDERNVLLTLARILATLRTGEIVSKTDAADRVAPLLGRDDRALLGRARDEYLGVVSVNWDEESRAVASLAAAMVEQINHGAR